MKFLLCYAIFFGVAFVSSLKFTAQESDYNLNDNEAATDPLQYSGSWPNHNYNPSPTNWRFPFYTLMLDRFVNGDPSNDDANGTVFEHDVLSNQFRHGGDITGLVDTLDYIQGMGIKGLYIAGTPFINQPWKADGYSPLDLTLLDRHLGKIQQWRDAIDEIHERGMYVILDNTMSTLGNLIGFDGFDNSSAPFEEAEHKVHWKTDRRYLDFEFGNSYNTTCTYPNFWDDTGFPLTRANDSGIAQLIGCYDSDFDQYGDIEAFGLHPDWQRQLGKFASVQDRLREWVPSVRERLQHFSCLTIQMLDNDGFRFDKATQITVDAQAEFGEFIRECARSLGKNNFFMPGEITGGNTFGSIYLGRGRQPNQVSENITETVLLTNASDDKHFLRDQGKNALDAAAFHYSIYRSLIRFLGMDGNLTAGFDVPLDFVNTWNTMLTTNDLVNPSTGLFDPRHMYGTTNQDVFRWPAIANGTQRMLLGQFITTLHMPGIPLLLWGEEQSFYILDSTAANYIFGRQAMSSSPAWQNHGCYNLGSTQYYDFPVEAAANGCNDDTVSSDHRDPSHPTRNVIKSFYQARQNYPVLNDGYFLQSLSNQTREVQLPGSNGTATVVGMWSTFRDQYPGVQNLTYSADSQVVWLVYQNDDHEVKYAFDCASNETALISPFPKGTTVKNILAPYDEHELETGPRALGIDGEAETNGCLSELEMPAWGFAAYVPKASWVAPAPSITKFSPGHDARLITTGANGIDTIDIELQFSAEMDCDGITRNMKIVSTVEGNTTASVDNSTVSCSNLPAPGDSTLPGAVASAWTWKATLKDVANGIHSFTVQNATSKEGNSYTDSNDRFTIRVGQKINPMVFPRLTNYSQATLFQDSSSKDLFVSHHAAGADQWRYSLNWASSWSDWQEYKGGNNTLTSQSWNGTKLQRWSGEHVILQYWSQISGSSDIIVHADLSTASRPTTQPRRFPHMFAQGAFNLFGFDKGLRSGFSLDSTDDIWKFHFMTELPSAIQVNVWGMNPDGQPDKSFVYGDVSNNSVLDRTLPDALAAQLVNFTDYPPAPYLAYQFEVSDATQAFRKVPVGSRLIQILLFALLWSIPILSGVLSIWIYMGAFYAVKFNKIGIVPQKMLRPFGFKSKFKKLHDLDPEDQHAIPMSETSLTNREPSPYLSPSVGGAVVGEKRRTVLIATIEYDIEDWKIKIKIGGLGVMAQLMGKSLAHQDLIWVVPCVGGVDYPIDEWAEPMNITILGKPYQVMVQYHKLRNITYVLLDAPIFRQQTTTDPYPPRMDDLDSAVYYSAWNACIAETINRFPVDLYHINDYHGAAAPLYLLPKTIPVALSLHNAEFQGLWPMRTPTESEEVCNIYNLEMATVQRYIQFGEVFNLLHAAASYLRVHQKGFGAVGVSNKYGDRSYARYPIFWGLKKIGRLPNPDPSDTAPWDPEEEAKQVIVVDSEFEASRGELRKQAQQWAQLNVDPTAELFVFVGRWSNQKGVDLIADVFPAVMEKHSKVQLICIGPVIDLYGKFAAVKLGEMMKKYPGRVFSKPEFTVLPPFIFTGAEFALIPSRDEPFGLVAVEFGRKGALGVGARVGGLGQMPGWWFTVESTTTKHLHHQFKKSIEEALESKTETRAMMRARSAKQRFPVAQWVQSLDELQSTAIKIHEEEYSSAGGKRLSRPLSGMRFHSRPHSRNVSGEHSRSNSLERPLTIISPPMDLDRTGETPLVDVMSTTNNLSRTLSLGLRTGPGHRRLISHDSESDIRLSGIGESELGERDLMNSSGGLGIDMPRGEVTITQEQAEISSRPARNMDVLPAMRTRDSSPSQALLGGSDRIRLHKRSSSGAPSPLIPLMLSHERSEGSPSPPLGSPDVRGRMRSRSGAESLMAPSPNVRGLRSSSVLSLSEVTGNRTDYKLQKVEPNFEDKNGKYYHAFEKMLTTLDGKNSESKLCIEEYLKTSEKAWFKRMREAKLGRSRDPSSNPSREPSPMPTSGNEGSFFSPFGRPWSLVSRRSSTHSEQSVAEDSPPLDDSLERDDEFLLGPNYQRENLVKRFMATRISDWPVYSFFLALGQIMAANSYQITLLTGGQGEKNEKLYIVGGIYVATSCLWWIMFRTMKSVYVVALPFVFYSLAFVFIGVSPFLAVGWKQDWLRNIATGLYTTGSSSGSLFFALNFGDEGGAPIKAWVARATFIQGSQQIFVTALFYWGSRLAASSNAQDSIPDITLTAITLPIAAALAVIGLLLFTSLPSYYHQWPGKIPSFYQTLLRRRIIGWFFITVVLQNYFLSTPYGRNWGYLWSSQHAPKWAVFILVFIFFVIVWAIFLYIFAQLSTSHSWILPLFAIGLLAPRWAQELWGTSGIGLWIPWVPGGPVAGALAGRSLWLWLGLLDSIQGVGFGMILLQTLTRIHIAATLIVAQILGTGITMLAKATANNRDGPGDVFPDFSRGISAALSGNYWFWIALAAQLVIPLGFYKFFRKEQLSKP